LKKIINHERNLPVILRSLILGTRADRRILNEDVKAPPVALKPVCKLLDRLEFGEVDEPQLCLRIASLGFQF
jgi:hypothetical protein